MCENYHTYEIFQNMSEAGGRSFSVVIFYMKFVVLFYNTNSRALVKNRQNLTIVDTCDNNDGPKVCLRARLHQASASTLRWHKWYCSHWKQSSRSKIQSGATPHCYRPQRSWGKVVFTRVCDSVHGGGVLSQHALQVVSQHTLQQVSKGGVCYPSMHCRWYHSMPCSRSPGGGLLLGGGSGAWSRGGLLWGEGMCLVETPSGRLLLRAVRILLECILVFNENSIASVIPNLLQCWPWCKRD